MTDARATPGRGSGLVRRGPLRLAWGPRSLDTVADAVGGAGVHRVLIVTGRSVAARPDLLDLADRAAAGGSVGVCTAVRAHSPLPAVLEVVEAIRAHRATALLAVGGGSAMVTARAACILAAEDGDPRALATRCENGRFVSPRLGAPKIPVFALPTTPTTATSKPGAAVTVAQEHSRLAYFDPKTRPRAIAVHPGLVASSPWELTRTAALDGLCMALEGLLSTSANLWSDAQLTHAARSLIALLREPDSTAMRTDLAVAAILAGDGSDISRGGLGAALAHVIGHGQHVANGLIESILAPHVLARVPVGHPGRGHVSWVLGCAPERAPEVLRSILDELGVPVGLTTVLGADADLGALAHAAMSDFAVGFSPGSPDAAEVEALLARAL